MEYYSTERKEVLIRIMTWMSLENVVLIEKSQSQKVAYCLITIIRNIQNRQIYKSRK